MAVRDSGRRRPPAGRTNTRGVAKDPNPEVKASDGMLRHGRLPWGQGHPLRAEGAVMQVVPGIGGDRS